MGGFTVEPARIGGGAPGFSLTPPARLREYENKLIAPILAPPTSTRDKAFHAPHRREGLLVAGLRSPSYASIMAGGRTPSSMPLRGGPRVEPQRFGADMSCTEKTQPITRTYDTDTTRRFWPVTEFVSTREAALAAL
jgi:hypothetical protein